MGWTLVSRQTVQSGINWRRGNAEWSVNPTNSSAEQHSRLDELETLCRESTSDELLFKMVFPMEPTPNEIVLLFAVYAPVVRVPVQAQTDRVTPHESERLGDARELGS